MHELRGDALVAEFAHTSDSVSAALAFQRANAAANETLSGELRPTLRMGIAMGEVASLPIAARQWRGIAD